MFECVTRDVTHVQFEELAVRIRASVGEYSGVSDGAADAVQTTRSARHSTRTHHSQLALSWHH